MTITDILKEKFIGKKIIITCYPEITQEIFGHCENIIEQFGIEETEWSFKLREFKYPIDINRTSKIEFMSKIERMAINLDLLTRVDRFRLSKVEDTKFNGEHPNGIDEGFMMEGTFREVPTVDESFVLDDPNTGRCLRTSRVTEIIDETTFRTRNSIYRLIKI